MAIPQEIVDRLARTLRIVRVDPPLASIGQFLRFSIGPDPALLRAVDPDIVVREVSVVLDAVMRGAIEATLEGLVPGSNATAVGAVPIPVHVPLDVSVTWRAYRYERASGSLQIEDIRDLPRVKRYLVPDEDFVAPDGVNATDVAFLFAPVFGELTMRPPVLQEIHVEAEVTLSLPDQDETATVVLGPVTVLLPRVPVPKLLALFRYPEFNLATEGGVPRKGPAVLLVVPAGSPLGAIGELRPVLSALRTMLTPLRNIRRFLRLLTGITLLESTLARRPRVRFAVADRIDDLHTIKLIRNAAWQDPWVNDQIPDVRGWPGDDDDNDIYAGGRMSSLIVLGPPETTVECFVAKYCNEEPDDVPPILRDGNYYANGRLVVTIGEEALVSIASLAYRSGETVPVTLPSGRAQADPQADPIASGFDDRISSIRF